MSRTRFQQAFDLHNMVAGPKASAVVQVTYKGEDGILACYGTAAITVLQAEAADTYAPGCIYTLVSGVSSKIYVNEGAAGAVADFALLFAVDQQSALTTELTDITHTAPGTPDYAIQDLTTTTPYGFVSQDEGNTLLKVVQANKVRIAEIEAALEALGLIA